MKGNLVCVPFNHVIYYNETIMSVRERKRRQNVQRENEAEIFVLCANMLSLE